MRPFSFFPHALLASIAGLFLFSCTTAPTNPYDKSNTKIFLIGKSSIQSAKEATVADSVGNTISIGFYGNLPSYLDSVQLKILLNGTTDSVLKVFNDLKSLKSTDTTWFALSFSDTETRTIIGTAYINNYNATFSDSILVHIYGKPLNHRPVLLVSGQTTIAQKGVCVLTVTAVDTDRDQKVSVSMLYGPAGARLTDTTFIWAPDSNFAGIDSAIFIAQDNGYPVMYDTVRKIITVTGGSTTSGPKWKLKTVNLVGQPGNSIKMTLSDKFTYAQKDNLIFTLLSGPPAGDSIGVSALDTAYFFKPGSADTGVFNPQIVVKNPAGASDTLTITLNVHVPSTIDSLPPTMKLLSPALDSAKVSSSALAITIRCTDQSGVAGIRCLMGVDTFTVSHSDSTYTAAVSGLKQGVFNTILFIAADSSVRANRDTLSVHIKYDSTVADNVPPIITLISPSKDTIIGSDSSVVRVKCTDASNIASVIYTLGSQTFTATRSIPTDSLFSATVKGLTAGVYSTIRIIATDASPAHNADTASVKIKYDNDKTAPALRLLLPAKDSTSVAGNATGIQVICRDASGVASVTYSMGAAPQPMTKSASADSVWSASVTGLTAGQFTTLSIIATDSSLAANKDTLAIHIKYDNDITAPAIARNDPPSDSMSFNANTYLVKVLCKDPSGVASVVFNLGAASFPAAKTSDSIWSANVTGLAAGVFSKILVIATDASLKANRDTMALSIKNDPGLTDLTGPIFFQISGPANNAVVTDSVVAIVDSVYDQSGVDSVYWTLNGANKRRITGAKGRYTLIDTLRRFNLDTFVVYAVDSATVHNKSSQSIILTYAIAPKITVPLQPAIAVNIGSPASLSITATAMPSPTYQWYFNGTAIPGANTASYSKTWAPTDAGTYKVVVTNVAGKDSSSTVLSVNVAAVISPKLAATTAVNSGSTSPLTITATGTPTPTYQWYFNGTAIATNGTSASYSKTWATTDAGTYKVVATNTAGKDSSTTVLSVNLGAVISTKLAATTAVNPGSTTPLTITATGTPTPTYQWYFNGTAIATNGTSASYSKTWATTDAGTYKVVATNTAGTDSSSTVLSVNNKATITTPLAATTAVNPGSTTALTITATGTPTPTYQWYFNGTAIATNGTSASYSKTWATTDAGTYKVVATNTAGTDSSSTVLSVNNKATITTPLAATTAVNPGSTTPLTITATGTPTPTYQWYFNGTAIATNGTSASYSKTWATTDAGTYKVVATNTAGKDSSSTVLSVNVAPVISPKLAATTTVVSGTSTALTITATGTPTPTYQWYFNGTAIATNGTSASYSKTWATTDAGTYKVVASNMAGKDSSTTVLSVNVKATITTPLAATTSVASGSSTALTIVATGTPTPTYQWYYNGTAITTNGTSSSYSKTWAFTDAGTYKVIATNVAGKDSSTTTLKVLGWQRIVQSTYDPQGSAPCAVISSNGDIYMAYQVPSPSGLMVDKLAANATQWDHTSSGSIASYNNFGGGFDIALSGNKTFPYVGYINSAEHNGGVTVYNGTSWTPLTTMPCGDASGSVSFDAFALDGNNKAVLNYHADAYNFAGLCDVSDNQATAQIITLDYAQAMALQFNSANALFWVHNKTVFQWNTTNLNFNTQYRTNIPDAVGPADTTCYQVVIRFDNNFKCYAMRTTGPGYPQVWQETNTSWQTFGGGPLKNGSASNIKLIFGDDQKFYTSYYDPDSTAIIIRQYDASSNTWKPFPTITNGKLSIPQFGTGYAFMIQNGTVYIVLDYGSGIGTWCYKP